MLQRNFILFIIEPKEINSLKREEKRNWLRKEKTKLVKGELSNGDISSTFFSPSTNNTVLEDNFNLCLDTARDKSSTVVFNTFKPFKTRPKLLQRLSNSEVDFIFHGYEQTLSSAANLKLILNFLVDQKNDKTDRAKAIQAGKSGNPNVKAFAALGAIEKKRKSKLNIPKGMARKIAVRLHETGKSLANIAGELARQGYTTTRNNHYSPKAVQRLLQEYPNVLEAFEPVPLLMGDENPELDVSIKIDDYNQSLNIDILNKNITKKKAIRVELLDVNYSLVQQKAYDTNKFKVDLPDNIDFSSDLSSYLKIFVNGYNLFTYSGGSIDLSSPYLIRTNNRQPLLEVEINKLEVDDKLEILIKNNKENLPIKIELFNNKDKWIYTKIYNKNDISLDFVKDTRALPGTMRLKVFVDGFAPYENRHITFRKIFLIE